MPEGGSDCHLCHIHDHAPASTLLRTHPLRASQNRSRNPSKSSTTTLNRNHHHHHHHHDGGHHSRDNASIRDSDPRTARVASALAKLSERSHSLPGSRTSTISRPNEVSILPNGSPPEPVHRGGDVHSLSRSQREYNNVLAALLETRAGSLPSSHSPSHREPDLLNALPRTRNNSRASTLTRAQLHHSNLTLAQDTEQDYYTHINRARYKEEARKQRFNIQTVLLIGCYTMLFVVAIIVGVVLCQQNGWLGFGSADETSGDFSGSPNHRDVGSSSMRDLGRRTRGRGNHGNRPGPTVDYDYPGDDSPPRINVAGVLPGGIGKSNTPTNAQIPGRDDPLRTTNFQPINPINTGNNRKTGQRPPSPVGNGGARNRFGESDNGNSLGSGKSITNSQNPSLNNDFQGIGQNNGNQNNNGQSQNNNPFNGFLTPGRPGSGNSGTLGSPGLQDFPDNNPLNQNTGNINTNRAGIANHNPNTNGNSGNRNFNSATGSSNNAGDGRLQNVPPIGNAGSSHVSHTNQPTGNLGNSQGNLDTAIGFNNPTGNFAIGSGNTPSNSGGNSNVRGSFNGDSSGSNNRGGFNGGRPASNGNFNNGGSGSNVRGSFNGNSGSFGIGHLGGDSGFGGGSSITTGSRGEGNFDNGAGSSGNGNLHTGTRGGGGTVNLNSQGVGNFNSGSSTGVSANFGNSGNTGIAGNTQHGSGPRGSQNHNSGGSGSRGSQHHNGGGSGIRGITSGFGNADGMVNFDQTRSSTTGSSDISTFGSNIRNPNTGETSNFRNSGSSGTIGNFNRGSSSHQEAVNNANSGNRFGIPGNVNSASGTRDSTFNNGGASSSGTRGSTNFRESGSNDGFTNSHNGGNTDINGNFNPGGSTLRSGNRNTGTRTSTSSVQSTPNDFHIGIGTRGQGISNLNIGSSSNQGNAGNGGGNTNFNSGLRNTGGQLGQGSSGRGVSGDNIRVNSDSVQANRGVAHANFGVSPLNSESSSTGAGGTSSGQSTGGTNDNLNFHSGLFGLAKLPTPIPTLRDLGNGDRRRMPTGRNLNFQNLPKAVDENNMPKTQIEAGSSEQNIHTEVNTGTNLSQDGPGQVNSRKSNSEGQPLGHNWENQADKTSGSAESETATSTQKGIITIPPRNGNTTPLKVMKGFTVQRGEVVAISTIKSTDKEISILQPDHDVVFHITPTAQDAGVSLIRHPKQDPNVMGTTGASPNRRRPKGRAGPSPVLRRWEHTDDDGTISRGLVRKDGSFAFTNCRPSQVCGPEPGS